MKRRYAEDGKKWRKTWKGVHKIGFACQEAVVLPPKKEPGAEVELLKLVRDDVAGDPISGRCWLRRSLEKVRTALLERGYQLCCETIRRLLRKHGISPKSNVRRLTPNPRPERDRQFTYIQRQRWAFETLGWPIISVDTKKRELIGPFANAGQVWCEKGTDVYMHDFASDANGKAIPYGIYDVQHNTGHVYVGQSADTAEFAVDTIAHWWEHTGSKLFPGASDLLIIV